MGDVTRRTFIQSVASPAVASTLAAGAATIPATSSSNAMEPAVASAEQWVVGHLTGAEAIVAALQAECVECVYGIPGAQENELWDVMKTRGLPYLLCTHEFSASMMADGYARVTGQPGVICVVPGPGLTNALTGIGEALLDSIPMVCLVGDVACGEKYRPFQVHSLPQVELLRPITKEVFAVQRVEDVAGAVRAAFAAALTGEPGPVGVVIPYNLLMEKAHFQVPPNPPLTLPWDETAFQQILCYLQQKKNQIGLYVGQGTMACTAELVRLAEILQAPVATSVSGKGAFPEHHPLSVGWGYGPQGSLLAEKIFMHVDTVLALGVKYNEVSTGFYSQPTKPTLLHVDINPKNLGVVMPTEVTCQADASLFLHRLLDYTDLLQRPHNKRLANDIGYWRSQQHATFLKTYPTRCGLDPMELILQLRQSLNCNALLFVDVTLSEHWAAEAFVTRESRTYFNPTDNQAMGWSIPAAIGAQRIRPNYQVVTLTGDGCFMMSAMELATAARCHLPVKVFLLDDQQYHYMEVLQESAYGRTTATILPRLDYAAMAQGLGVGYLEIATQAELSGGVQAALEYPGPVLVRVCTEYSDRPCRWVSAVRGRFINELDTRQQLRFAARLGKRALSMKAQND